MRQEARGDESGDESCEAERSEIAGWRDVVVGRSGVMFEVSGVLVWEKWRRSRSGAERWCRA